ncbi:hypothetical protein F2Q69_00051311 [Brassica cretica]|uniref:Uncharacterized protein n=1 Tax=Brassica cretica TaxID=69181 RepID=A0A8S9Q1J2_BRACR|nr:hypothetical protein F2Q69_00051311 [Brassica cretica]
MSSIKTKWKKKSIFGYVIESCSGFLFKILQNPRESLASLELRREATSCGSLWGLDLTWILRLCSDLGQIRDPSLAGILRRVAANAVLASPSRSNRLLPQLVSRSRANPMACFGDRCSFPSRWLMSKAVHKCSFALFSRESLLPNDKNPRTTAGFPCFSRWLVTFRLRCSGFLFKILQNPRESLASLELRREATSCGSLWGLDLTWILRLCSDLGQIRDPSLAGILRRVAANAVLASPSRSNRLLPQLVSRSRANPMACFGDRCSFPSRWLMSKGWVLRTTLSEGVLA